MEQTDEAKWLRDREIERVVRACIEDVRYLLSVHCPLFGLDSSQMFDNFKEELEVEFRDNIRTIYGTE